MAADILKMSRFGSLKNPLLDRRVATQEFTGSASLSESPFDTHKMTLKAVQRKRSMKELSGILYVRVVGASDLAAADHKFLQAGKGSSDPYTVISVTDDEGHVSQRRTQTIFETLEPTWREEFKFGVAKKCSGLTLTCEVFDEDVGEPKDDYLGQAVVDLQPYVNGHKATQSWHQLVLDLNPLEVKPGQHLAFKIGEYEVSGQITLKIRWDPISGSCWRILKAVMSSSKALSTIGSILVGTAAYLLLVASRARWLCSGTSFSRCTVMEVHGTTSCCILASIVAFVATGIQLVGAFGMLGKAWNCAPPHMLDLLEDPDEDQYVHLGEEDMGLDVNMKVKGLSVMVQLGFPEVSNDLFRKPLFALRLIAWCMKLVALVFTGLAMYFTLVPRGKSCFLAEGFFLAMAAQGNVLLGGLLLGRAGMLHAALLESEWKVFQKTKLGRYMERDEEPEHAAPTESKDVVHSLLGLFGAGASQILGSEGAEGPAREEPMDAEEEFVQIVSQKGDRKRAPGNKFFNFNCCSQTPQRRNSELQFERP